MEHLVTARAVIGGGEDAIVLEARAGSVRIKRRGMPDLFVPIEAASDVARFLLAASAAGESVVPRRPAAATRARVRA